MSAGGSVTGTVLKIGDVQEFTSGFCKRELVVEEGGNYPQPIAIEFPKDKMELVESLQVGQEVTVHYNVRGREWNDRHFVNLQGWRVEAGEVGDSAPVDGGDISGGSVDDDDLPF